MSLALTQHLTYRATMKRILPWLGMALCLTALAVHLAWDFAGWRFSAAAAVEAQGAAQNARAAGSRDAPPANPATTIVLSDAKFQAAKLSTAEARYDELSTDSGSRAGSGQRGSTDRNPAPRCRCGPRGLCLSRSERQAW